MITHTAEIRVRYQETDAMGISYHGNYLSWFEVARVSMLDKIGQPYRELESLGLHLPVLEAYAKYKNPSYFDDRLSVTCMIKELPRVRIHIDYNVTREDKVITTGYTTHAFMDNEGRAIKPPTSFMHAIEKSL